ncbi:hypothetical protein GGI43DRAFT_21556 [Trichoderma evansii]
MPLFQRPDSKNSFSAREEDIGRSRGREFCEIEGHTFFCRCKKFPGTGRNSYDTHTHALLTHSPSITQQTGQTNKPAPRPLPTRHQVQLVNQSFIPFQLAFRRPIWVLVSARLLLTCAGGWCCTLVVSHLRHSSVSRCPSPEHRVWAGLTMQFFEGRRPSNVLLHTQGPRTRAYSQFRGLFPPCLSLTNGLVKSDNGRCARLFGRDD